MEKRNSLLAIVFCALIGCQPSPTSVPFQATPTSPKQPMQLRSIDVEISGLPENAFVTLNISKPPSSQSFVSAERGNGIWNIDVPLYCDSCIVTATASGYTSIPISYTIKIVDGSVQVYDENNKIIERAIFTFTH